ncbi:hypothetical protein T06_9760 [Trichinella sp. T6]|nr:hypothetical protein T06_9760 [Trichinella sp. T6]
MGYSCNRLICVAPVNGTAALSKVHWDYASLDGSTKWSDLADRVTAPCLVFNVFKSTHSKAEESVDTRKTITKLILKLYHHRFVCDTRTSLHRTLALVSFPTSSTRTNGSYFTSALSKSLYRIDLGDPLLYLLGSMGQYGQNTDLYTQK